MKSFEKPEQRIADPFENVSWVAARSLLAREGFEPEQPEDLDDLRIRGRLWELIYAMAGRGFYLACTDHLSDAELLHWLHEQWLDENAADLPAGQEWNARVSPVTFASEEEGTRIWLRYYADEEERQQFSAELLPPHEDPQYDRDRFLPEAPMTVEEMEDAECECIEDGDIADFLDAESFEEEEDLLGLGAVDAAIRENAEANDDDDVPASKEWKQPLRMLQREGVCLFPPDEHTDDTIGAGLWELLHELACRGFYVLHTDHLTDRELYEALWKDSLRERAVMPEDRLETAWYHDLVGGGSEEAERVRLRYYATDKERAKAQKEHPGWKLPPHEEPVAHRDWRLPRGPI